jgi:hypothetical protein
MFTDLSFLQSEQTLVPFLFVLAIVFGVLELTNIFKNRAVNFLIALTLSIFTITNSNFVTLLWSNLGSVSTFFIIMFLIAFVFEVFGLRPKGNQPKEHGSSIIIEAGILFILLSIGFSYASQVPSLPLLGGGQNLIFLFAIVFILVIFWSAFRIGSPPQR